MSRVRVPQGVAETSKNFSLICHVVGGLFERRLYCFSATHSVHHALLLRAHGVNRVEAHRYLNIHEYQSYGLLNEYGVRTPRHIVGRKIGEIDHNIKTLGEYTVFLFENVRKPSLRCRALRCQGAGTGGRSRQRHIRRWIQRWCADH